MTGCSLTDSDAFLAGRFLRVPENYKQCLRSRSNKDIREVALEGVKGPTHASWFFIDINFDWYQTTRHLRKIGVGIHERDFLEACDCNPEYVRLQPVI